MSLGATFRSSATVRLDGHTEFELQYLPGLSSPTSLGAQADFEFPLTAVFGISYRPTPKWNLEFDADYTDWSSFGKTSINQSSAPPPSLLAKQPCDTRLAAELDVRVRCDAVF